MPNGYNQPPPLQIAFACFCVQCMLRKTIMLDDCKVIASNVKYGISVMRIAMGIALQWIHWKTKKYCYTWNGWSVWRVVERDKWRAYSQITSWHIALGAIPYKSSMKLGDFDTDIEKEKSSRQISSKQYAFGNVDFMNAWSIFWWFDHPGLLLLYLFFFVTVSLLLPLSLSIQKNSWVFVVADILTSWSCFWAKI